MKEQEAGEEEGTVVREADILEIVVVEVMEQWEGVSCRQTPVHYDSWKKKIINSLYLMILAFPPRAII